MKIDAEGKVAVVVGGSGGIGAATVRMLAEAGAKVVIGYNSSEAGARALMETLPGSGHAIRRISFEDSAGLIDLAAFLRERYGRLDIVVNSGGFTRPIPHADLDALDDALFDAIYVSNVRGPFALVRSLAPLMRETGAAVVINVSSVSGFTGAGSNIAYCASKGALDTMTLSLARALGPQIRVLLVSPGAVATDFVAGRDRSKLEVLAEASPLKRVVEPEDVARAILVSALCLNASTGGTIIIDGGRHLG